MLELVKECMKEINIDKYQIIEHNITKTAVDSSESKMKKKMEVSYFVDIFFDINGKWGKISIDKSEKIFLLDSIKNYIISEMSYIKEINEDTKKIMSLTKQKHQIRNLEYKKIINHEIEETDKKYPRFSSSNIYIYDKIRLVTRNVCHEQSIEKCISYFSYDDNGMKFYGTNDFPYKGMYSELIMKSKSKYEINMQKMIEGRDLKQIVVSKEILSKVLNLFVNFLDGSLIVADNSYFKTEDIGKKVMSEDITIKDVVSDNSNRLHFDAEGNTIISKTLVNKGVIESYLNNELSANYLKQQPGNAFYNYFSNSIQIEPVCIEFKHTVKLSDKKGIESVLKYIMDENIVLDNETGEFSMTCIGNKVSGENFYYILKMNILEFFNSIVGEIADSSSIDSMIVPSVLINLEEKNDNN